MTCLEGALALDDSDYKNTAKLTWLAKLDSVAMTPTVIVHFDHLITKDVLKPDEDFKDFVNRDSMVRGRERERGGGGGERERVILVLLFVPILNYLSKGGKGDLIN